MTVSPESSSILSLKALPDINDDVTKMELLYNKSDEPLVATCGTLPEIRKREYLESQGG